MKLAEQVACAIEDAEEGKLESALLHACISIDATSKRLYPGEVKVGHRYIDCLRHYYWILEPMIGSGINLVETTFSNVALRNNPAPDLAAIIYESFRCGHVHGDEVGAAYSVLPSHEENSHWRLSEGELHMPDRLIWALLGVAVFARVNPRRILG